MPSYLHLITMGKHLNTIMKLEPSTSPPRPPRPKKMGKGVSVHMNGGELEEEQTGVSAGDLTRFSTQEDETDG
jgi:hypothetical protein